MLALALALTLSAPAHAEAPAPLIGLGTAGGAALLAVPGMIGGMYAWTAVDVPDPDECAGAVDHCMPGGAARGIFIGMPLGAATAGIAGGTLTHHFLSGHGDAKVALAGGLAASASFAVMGAGFAVARTGEDGSTAALLVLTGMGGAVVAPPIAMGVVSGKQARLAAAETVPVALNDVGFLAVEGGGGLRIGGHW